MRTLGTRTIHCLQMSSLHFCPPRTLLAGTSNPARSCKPCWFSRRKLLTTRWWLVDSSEDLLTRASNTDWSKSAETLQKSVVTVDPKNLCTRSTFAQGWKNIFLGVGTSSKTFSCCSVMVVILH